MQHGATVELMLAMAVVIGAAKAGGYVAMRLGQPSVLGELLSGIILGPSVINMFGGTLFAHADEVVLTVNQLAQLGVLVLMFVAGLEVDIDELVASGRPATLAGVLGVVAPMILGTALALAVGREPTQAIFIGVVLSATSVSISAQTLIELGALRTVVGVTLLTAAVVDDIIVVLLLSLFLALAGGGGAGSLLELGVIGLRMTGFLLGALLVGRFLVAPLSRRAAAWGITEGPLAFALLAMLLYGWSAEALGGVAAITGAFIAGLFVARSPHRAEVERGTHALAYALLVPIFFVSVGLNANLRALAAEDLPFALGLIVVAVLSKVVGCGAGAALGGLARAQAWQVGVGMISRGEVGLIVAGAGLSIGLISQREFTEVVLVVLATTLITPILLRRAVSRWPQHRPSPPGGLSAGPP